MQIKCLFTASDKDSIVTGNKRQVKVNQFLIYTKMKSKRYFCLLGEAEAHLYKAFYCFL